MEDFLYPKHMLYNVGIGDITISHKNAAGQLYFQETKTEEPPGAKENVLVNFLNGGTGFIINKKKISIGQTIKNLALVLTAGHAVCDLVTLNPLSKNDFCYLENGELRKIYLIGFFMNSFPYELQSSLTSSFYCLPGDIAILLLEAKRGKIDYYEISSDIKVGMDCFVSEFPKKPKDFRYCLPQLVNNIGDEATNEANRIFCCFDKKVFAEGKIESENNGLLEVSCLTTNGMLGSPIISEGKFVGIYIGGPPVPGQRESLKIIHCLNKNENPIEIFRDIRDLLNLDMHFMDQLFEEIINTEVMNKFGLLSKAMAGKVLTQEEINKIQGFGRLQMRYDQIANSISTFLSGKIYYSVLSFRNKELFKANVGISNNHRAFNEKIRIIVNKFSECTIFASLDDLINHLKN